MENLQNNPNPNFRIFSGYSTFTDDDLAQKLEMEHLRQVYYMNIPLLRLN